MRLYELSQQWESVLEMAEQLEPEALKDTLDSIEEAINDKVENTAYVVKQLDANVAAIDTEIKRLQTMKSAQTNNAKNLKLYIQESMEKVGLDKVQGNLIKVAIQNNPPSLLVKDEQSLDGYLVEQPPTLDKKSIIKHLKEGIEVVGAELQQTRSIRIR